MVYFMLIHCTLFKILCSNTFHSTMCKYIQVHNIYNYHPDHGSYLTEDQSFSVNAKTRLMNNFHRVLFIYLQLMIRKIRIYCIFEAY